MAGHKSKRKKITNSGSKPKPGAAADKITGGALSDDIHQVWVLASNCAIYEADPGPVQVNVGTAAAPTMVSWAESWRIAYTRHVLADLDVDAARIHAAGAECARKATETSSAKYALAAELCRRAAAIAEQAGADRDEAARKRLAAVTAHHNHLATMAMMGITGGPAVEDNAAELQQELRAVPGDPDLATLTALVTGVATAAAAGPAPSAQRVLHRFAGPAGPAPRVQQLLVDEPAAQLLGEETLAELAASLWAVDCQSCGRALGSDTPALVLRPAPGERLAAALHHDGCVPTTADWNRTGSGQIPNLQHNSWTYHGCVLAAAPNNPDRTDYPMLVINPRLENAVLQKDAAGAWHVVVAPDFEHLGLVAPTGHPTGGSAAAPRLDGVIARVTNDSIAITLRDGQSYEAFTDDRVREVARAYGGVLLVATHQVWLAGLSSVQQVYDLWNSKNTRVGLVGLHGTSKPKKAPNIDATFVLQWNPKILTAGFEIATTADDLNEQQAKDWAAAAITAAATGDVVLIDWQVSNRKQPADGWFVLDAIATNMYALRRTEDGTWRVSRCLSRHDRANDYNDNEARAWAAQVLDRHGIAGLKWEPGPTTTGSQTLYALTRKGE